jgi:ribosomal protein L29
MINKEIRKELKNLEVRELERRSDELRRELFQLRLKSATAHIKDFASDKRKLRKAIACALTLLQQKNLERK